MSCLLLAASSLHLGAQSAQPVDSDPRTVAQKIWGMMLTKCGDAYYRADPDSSYLQEFKQVTFDLMALPLSPADVANGVQWQGYALVGSALSREWRAPDDGFGHREGQPKWSKWETGESVAELKRQISTGLTGIAPTIVKMIRTKGQWSFEAGGGLLLTLRPYHPESERNRTCSTLPKE